MPACPVASSAAPHGGSPSTTGIYSAAGLYLVSVAAAPPGTPAELGIAYKALVLSALMTREGLLLRCRPDGKYSRLGHFEYGVAGMASVFLQKARRRL